MKDKEICRHCGHVRLAHDEPDGCGLEDCGCQDFQKMKVIRLRGGRFAEIVKINPVEIIFQETIKDKMDREAANLPEIQSIRYTAIITKEIPNHGYLTPSARNRVSVSS